MTLRDTPYPDAESTGPTFRPPSHQAFDDFIFAFFAVEMVIKMVALGLFGQKCYLGDTWNRLDFFIVMAGYSSLPLTAQLYEAVAPGVVPYLTKPGWEPCLLRPRKRPWVPKEEGGAGVLWRCSLVWEVAGVGNQYGLCWGWKFVLGLPVPAAGLAGGHGVWEGEEHPLV